MQYFFDYGFAKEYRWLDGIHKKESYDDGKKAFQRYLEIQRQGHKAEKEMQEAGTLPEGNRFLCTIDIFHDGQYNEAAVVKFACDAFEILVNEEKVKLNKA